MKRVSCYNGSLSRVVYDCRVHSERPEFKFCYSCNLSVFPCNPLFSHLLSEHISSFKNIQVYGCLAQCGIIIVIDIVLLLMIIEVSRRLLMEQGKGLVIDALWELEVG